MSYYTTPYFAQPAYYRQSSPQQQNQLAMQLHPHQTLQAQGTEQLAQEEAQALAYLQSVQRRRQAAEAAAALEARQRAHAQQQRQIALKEAAERHAQGIAAARRERAIRETLERERARELAFAQAVQARRQEAIQQAVEEERKRQAAAAEAYARSVREARERSLRLQQQAQQAQVEAQRAQPQSQQPAAEDSQENLDALNQLFGALFGFNLASEDPSAQLQDSAPKTEAEQAAPPQTEAKQVAPPKAAPATKDAEEEEDGYSGLPPDLNDLLSQFLGLEVTPAKDNEVAPNPSKEIVNNAVGDLNEFLSRYGLEFTPDSDEEDHEDATQQPQSQQQAAPCCGWWVPDETEQPKEVKAAPKSVPEPAAPEALPATADVAPTPSPTQPSAAKETPTPAEKTEAAPVESKPTPAESKPTPPAPTRQRTISKPDPDAALTSTLGNYQNVPPFLREILANIEGALAEDDKNEDNCARRKARKLKAQERRKQRAAARAQKFDVPSDEEVEEHRNVAAAAAEVGHEVEENHDFQKDEKNVGKDVQQTRGVADAAAGKEEPRAVFQDAAQDAAQVGKKVEEEKAYQKDEENVGKDVDQTRNVAQAATAETQHRDVADAAAAKGAAVEEHRDAYAEAAKVGKKVEEQHAYQKDEANVGKNVQQTREIAADTKPTPKSKTKSKSKSKKSQLKADAPAFDPANASPEAKAAFKEIEDLQSKLNKLKADFKFPAQLAFAPSPTDATQPPLLFTRVNTPYHAQANALLQLLLEVDGIQSGGDKAIRRERKSLVTRIEDALADLEAKRDARWSEVKERRERGESDEEDDWHITDATTEDE